MMLQDKELEDKMEEQNSALFQKAIVKKFFLLFHLFHILFQRTFKAQNWVSHKQLFKSFIVGLWLMINFAGTLTASPEFQWSHAVLSVYLGSKAFPSA